MSAEEPAEGDYYTDEVLLYEIVGTDTDGYFYLQDCGPDWTDAPTTLLKLSLTELSRFRHVSPAQ